MYSISVRLNQVFFFGVMCIGIETLFLLLHKHLLKLFSCIMCFQFGNYFIYRH